MADVTTKQLADHYGITKPTVKRVIKELIAQGIDLDSHTTRRSQTDCYDNEAAAIIASELDKRYPVPAEPNEPITNPYKVLYEELKIDRSADRKRHQQELDMLQSQLKTLQDDINGKRQEIDRLTADLKTSRQELEQAKSVLVQISAAGLFVNKKKLAAAYLALPPGN